MANSGCLPAPRCFRNFATGLLFAYGLTACGGGSGSDDPVNIDYSTLKIAESREVPLEYAQNGEDILRPLRNGARIMTSGGTVMTVAGTPSSTVQSPRSDTTVQVAGVDEADYVKYDGQYLYAAKPEFTPPLPNISQWSRNVLNIARTTPAAGGIERVTRFVIEGETNTAPMLYLVRPQQGPAEYVTAVSQDYRGWMTPQSPVAALVAQPDRTIVQLLDVRDPQNVSQAWKLDLDGWLITSRKIDDTLYVVASYRPRIIDLVLPADTREKQEANERRIRNSSASDLLPGYHENGGTRRPLVTPSNCLVTQQLGGNEGYTDLVVISSVNLRTRQVKGLSCLSTNVNGVYMSQDSLYVAGTGYRTSANLPVTVLHKFALANEAVTYRATGAVAGGIPWSTASYFMDEHNGDLRILTTSNGPQHRLTVLREAAGHNLMIVSNLPNADQPAPIGKPNESVYAVRFVNDRAADTPHPTQAGQFTWTYSGLHLLEVTGLESGAPQLHFQGVIKTDEPVGIATSAPYVWPNRVALHGDGVFAVSGDRFFSSLWRELPGR
jgi:hypothetical protein